jgi:hypothetical protein
VLEDEGLTTLEQDKTDLLFRLRQSRELAASAAAQQRQSDVDQLHDEAAVDQRRSIVDEAEAEEEARRLEMGAYTSSPARSGRRGSIGDSTADMRRQFLASSDQKTTLTTSSVVHL